MPIKEVKPSENISFRLDKAQLDQLRREAKEKRIACRPVPFSHVLLSVKWAPFFLIPLIRLRHLRHPSCFLPPIPAIPYLI
jgi:hypothetical protein